MKPTFKSEIPLLVITIIPLPYLAYVWNTLPESVPMHWNGSGEIDRYGNKSELIWVTLSLTFLTYILLLIIPAIDPKKKLAQMGNKYFMIKLTLLFCLTGTALYIIESARNASLLNMKFFFTLIGFVILVFGNYMKTLRSNYFIGIRTPWTLENENVWKSTHHMAGILWFAGGVIIIITSLAINIDYLFPTFFTILILISIIPAVYSYIEYRRLKVG